MINNTFNESGLNFFHKVFIFQTVTNLWLSLLNKRNLMRIYFLINNRVNILRCYLLHHVTRLNRSTQRCQEIDEIFFIFIFNFVFIDVFHRLFKLFQFLAIFLEIIFYYFKYRVILIKPWIYWSFITNRSKCENNTFKYF